MSKAAISGRLAALFALLALAGCNRNGAAISAQDVGPGWPFKG